jgi:broad specificity phosphatase PhoE
MPITRVYLIRHGATEANRARPYRLQGRGTDLPLDGLGRLQAERAAEALVSAGLKLDAVYSSPLRRAFETAQIVGEPHGLEPRPLDGLTEADVGRWEGLTWEEVQAREPDLYERFHADPGRVPYPEGESFADVAQRVSPIIAALVSKHPGETVAVVAHNVVNRAYLAGLLGVPIERARTLRQSNGGINVIEYQEDGQAQVFSVNSALHLEGVETAGAKTAG